jgi:hypothetical protein
MRGGNVAASSLVTASVLGIDIESFSSRDMEIQAELQADLRKGFDEACERVGLVLAPDYRQGTGDGSMNVFTQDVDVAVLAGDLPRELAIWLSARNRTRTDEGRLRLRVALHRGYVGVGPIAWQGQTVVETARLLECSAGRQVLRSRADATLVLLVSEAVYAAAVRERRRGLDPEDFVPVALGADVPEKGSGFTGWACLYGRGPLAAPAIHGAENLSPARQPAPQSSRQRDRGPAGGPRSVRSASGNVTVGDDSPITSGDLTFGLGPAQKDDPR